MISVSVWGVFFFSLRFHMWVRLCNIYLCLISLSIMSLLLSKIARSKVFFTWGNDLKKNTVRPSLVHLCMLSHFSWVQLCTIPWTVAHQAPLSMGVSRQAYWSRLPYPPPGDLPHPGVKPMSLTSPVLAGGFFTAGAIWEAQTQKGLITKEFTCS